MGIPRASQSENAKIANLEIDNIELTEWTWDGAFEFMRVLRKLQTIPLPSNMESLKQHGEQYPSN